MGDWDRETGDLQKKCDEVLAKIRAQKKLSGGEKTKEAAAISNQIKDIDARLKKLEKDLSVAEEKRLVTSGELQKREDTLVDLTNFRDRLEQLMQVKKPGEIAIQIDDEDDDDGDGRGQGSEATSGELLKLQRNLREEQDQHLESLSQVIARQKQLGMMIGEELDLQSDMLDDLDSDLDRTKGKMSRTMRTLDKVGKGAKNRKGTIAICILIVVIVLAIVLAVVLRQL